MTRLQRFAWLVLAYNLAVILWGAFVRATGSGAGCGSHWPLCNGQVVLRSPSAATLIEYSHRLTSGIALLAVVALLVWVWRASRPGHPARTGAALSLFFMLTEAAVGAGLVLFELVADNASMARALFMAVHLLNTFVLLACITLTAWWLGEGRPLALRDNSRAAAGLAAAAAAILLVSSSGAVAALGDTLFPSTSLDEALRADVSATSHMLIRLRVLHPVLAVGAVVMLAAMAPRLARRRGPRAVGLAHTVMWLAAVQLGFGFLNVILLAPVWLQLVHLLLADAIWIAFVLLGATVLETPATADARSRVTPSARRVADHADERGSLLGTGRGSRGCLVKEYPRPAASRERVWIRADPRPVKESGSAPIGEDPRVVESQRDRSAASDTTKLAAA